MNDQQLVILLFLVGLIGTTISVVTTALALKHGINARRGDTFACAALFGGMIGPLLAIDSILYLVNDSGASGWAGVGLVALYVLGFAGAYTVAIRRGMSAR